MNNETNKDNAVEIVFIYLYIPLYTFMYLNIITCIIKLYKSYNLFKHLVYNVHLNCMAILPILLNLKGL